VLGNLFQKKSKAVVGIDISTHAVKLVELSRSGNRFQLEAYAAEPLPQGAVVDQSVADETAVSEVIKKVFAKSRTNCKQAAIAVAGSAVITKVIQMPHGLNDFDIENQLQIEADQHIPYPIDEVALDFEVLGPSENGTELVDVLIAACRRETVDRREDAVNMYKADTVTIIDVEAFALERAFALVEPQLPGGSGLVAMVDIGAYNTTLSVMERGNIIYTRDQSFGGQLLTEEIQRRYGLSQAEAEREKVEGGLPGDYQSEILDPFKENVVQQISRALQFFFSSSQFNTVDAIVLAGGTASINGLSRMVEEKLGARTVTANPFADMKLTRKVNAAKAQNDAPGLMVACGLAMRSFD
jgi:type IV pilus assembly protein PilM